MILRFISSFILVVATVSSFAQKGDTVLIQKRAYERSAVRQNFIITPYLNPALNYYRYSDSYSSLSISGDWDNESRALNAQEGDGWGGFKVAADSYVRMSDASRIWGNAYYHNGERKNVQWNESADYDLIYPYVMADTIGGDIKSETYFFEGGYAASHGRWTFGGEFSYRALLEYRDVDPRPRNSIADLQGKAGASYQFNKRYAVALSAEAHKYKQNGDITYYNELGVSKTFHLSGLGTSYTRFDGTRNTVRYQGHIFGAGLDLLPVKSDGGWTSSVSYQHAFYEKILPGANDLTLNELDEDRYQGEIAWTSATTRNHSWGIKANAEFRDRKGTEILYGDAVNSIYPQIATAQQFGSERLWSNLSAFYEQEQTKVWRWSLQPAVGYHYRKDTYKSPSKKVEYSLFDTSLAFTSTWRWKQDMLFVRIWGAHQEKLDATLDIGQVTHPYAMTILQQNFDMQSSGNTSDRISLRWSKNVFKNMLAHLEAGWQQARYTNSEKGTSLWVNIGLSL